MQAANIGERSVAQWEIAKLLNRRRQRINDIKCANIFESDKSIEYKIAEQSISFELQLVCMCIVSESGAE